MKIDSIKKEHTLYSYIPQDNNSNFTIIVLEDNTSQQRIQNLLYKQIFIYFEHISSLINDISPNFIKELLIHQNFLGFITHSIDTLNIIKTLYPESKCYYLPVGVDIQYNNQRFDQLNFLFWSSWNDVRNNNFCGRGGYYADEIFLRIRQQIPTATLTIRSNVPLKSQQTFPKSVISIQEYLSKKDLFKLYQKNNFYLLCSAQAHFITIPEATSFGMIVVGNNNWGWEENITDNFNGIKENCNQKWEESRDRNTVDWNYIDVIVERILKMTKEDMIEISINAKSFQRMNHCVNNYSKLIESILSQVQNQNYH